MASILVIDDDRQVRVLLQEMLESAGHRVETAENGAVGLEAISRSAFDLVISDIFMPEMEGIETILSLRRDRPELKIIAISGGSPRAPMDFLPMARLAGAVATLEKPILRRDLLNAVDSALAAPAKSNALPAQSEPLL